jgi:hypothetical protein
MKKVSCKYSEKHHRNTVIRNIDVISITEDYSGTFHVENVIIKECIYCGDGILDKAAMLQIDEFIEMTVKRAFNQE